MRSLLRCSRRCAAKHVIQGCSRHGGAVYGRLPRHEAIQRRDIQAQGAALTLQFQRERVGLFGRSGLQIVEAFGVGRQRARLHRHPAHDVVKRSGRHGGAVKRSVASSEPGDIRSLIDCGATAGGNLVQGGLQFLVDDNLSLCSGGGALCLLDLHRERIAKSGLSCRCGRFQCSAKLVQAFLIQRGFGGGLLELLDAQIDV